MVRKAAIITGASSGIGRATAIEAALEGYAVLLVATNPNKLTETQHEIEKNGGTAVVAVADVSDADAVKAYVDKALAEFGRIDGFFNNAGMILPGKPLIDIDDDDFDRCMAVNLRGLYLGLKHVLPVMLGQGSGSVVMTGSMNSVGGVPGLSPYSATKSGLLGLMRTAALEVASKGVRVNAVLPGNIRTRMMLDSIPGSDEEAEAMAAALVPQGNIGTPEDIAHAVMFLFSEKARHITGTALPVDGGITAQVYPQFNL